MSKWTGILQSNLKFIRIYYNTNSRGLGNFSWISLLDLLAFWNFERRFSNLEAVLYMTVTPAYSKSARARSQNNYY
jgi:hypothetical protein